MSKQQHQVRITTATGDRFTSLPAPGSAAELLQVFSTMLDGAEHDTVLGFETSEGSVVVRARVIETIEILDSAQEPSITAALADCGDQA